MGLIVVAGWIAGMAQPAVANENHSWEFTEVGFIELDGISGDVILRPAEGESGIVEMDSNVYPEKNFRAEVEQRGDALYIEEKWKGGSSSGNVAWYIYVPSSTDGLKIHISTTSGNLDGREVSAKIKFDTASGDVSLTRMKLQRGSDFDTASGDYEITDMTVPEGTEFNTASGDLELVNLLIEEDCEFSTASGDIDCKRCQCEQSLKLDTASGDVNMRDCELFGECSLSSASGDVSVYLDKLPQHDLYASTASGNVLLAAQDFGEDFTLVLIKREDKGKISCPFSFTSEETFENHHTYERKTVERGSGRPEIELRTASGRVTVRD
jgi:DUF4097 and DUF4098 domain-containing protein YvlB